RRGGRGRDRGARGRHARYSALDGVHDRARAAPVPEQPGGRPLPERVHGRRDVQAAPDQNVVPRARTSLLRRLITRETAMKIGFIGLGNMGGPMALNLMKAGHTLVVHDVRRDAAKPHLDGGATWADSPQAAARGAELVLTSLPGPPEVEVVMLGANGIIHGVNPGTIVADLSTNSPTVMRRIAAAFKAKGVHVLDAPVSGGAIGAKRGTLQVMVGGEESIFREVKDVFLGFGNSVGYM